MFSFPTQRKILKKDNKTYVIFPDYTGVMLADKLYHSTGQKAGQRITLTAKQIKEVGCPQPGVGWYASEKLDGLRAIWTGRELVARPTRDASSQQTMGKVWTYVPQTFLDQLPGGIALDGEMWLGRGRFQEISGLSSLKVSPKRPESRINEIWEDVTYMIFDAPGIPGMYEERMKKLGEIIGKKKQIKIVKNYHIRSDEELMKIYKTFTKQGAEGIMLRAPNSPYEAKRSKLVLKMKVQDDTEALVTGFQAGTGKYDRKVKGNAVLGALKCKLPNGVEFNIGTGFTDTMRENYWDKTHQHYIPLGCTVNFSYMEFTSEGVPRHPAFRGVRDDVVLDVPKVQRQVHAEREEDPEEEEPGKDYKEIIVSELKEHVGYLNSETTETGSNMRFKMAKYKKAINAFSVSTSIGSVADALSILRNAGEKLVNEDPDKPTSTILQKVKSIIQNGGLDSNESQRQNPRTVFIKQACSIPHTGPEKAKELWDFNGMRSLEELKTNTSLLTSAQQLGLLHYKDLQLKIPRAEMDVWNELLKRQHSLTQRYVNGKIDGGDLVGSYRRGSSSSGDVDFMIVGDVRLIHSLLQNLEESGEASIVGCYSKGIKQWQGLAQLPGKPVRHLDIFCFKPEVYPWAMLHYTGSANFNVLCRNRAKELGFSMSQYGLKKNGSANPPVFTKERDVLEWLHGKWVEPSER